ncbi:hypothetical protein H0H81_007323 [Sphagnurus paluster]|uniref:Transmembrane protein n=1 Tax=Sphagnurus paluster TaxID=117069 RepID=A0A9P7FXI1_9AGAR|nr:hypothetical protein H0H81_007323 [Sphagnurus paluster]
MRPEKSWRPIVTVEVDKQHCHETIMGIDGQNPNQKERFYLHDAHAESHFNFRVWYRSPTKRKAKRRLVGSASHSLGELLRRQGNEPRPGVLFLQTLSLSSPYLCADREEIEIRLQCHDASKRAISSRGKPQNGATLLFKIRPPAPVRPLLVEDEGCASSSEAESSTMGTQSPSRPSSPKSDAWPDEDTLQNVTVLKRRRRVVGYAIDTDDEVCSTDGDDCEEHKPFIDDNSYCDEDERSCFDEPGFIRPLPEGFECVSGPAGWTSIFPSVLPQYTEKIEVPSDMTFAERVLASFTTYKELKAARLDEQYQEVFLRLQMEWTYVAGLLVAELGISAAIFAISPDTVFTVDSYARVAIAASSIASGLGLTCDAWFLLRYNWADVQTLINRARDLYGSYFFFSLSARVPALCLFTSAVALMVFMVLVAFDVWPTGVIVTCFFIGLIMTLQFLVFGAHWFGLRIAGAARKVVIVSRRATMSEKVVVVGAGNGGTAR